MKFDDPWIDGLIKKLEQENAAMKVSARNSWSEYCSVDSAREQLRQANEQLKEELAEVKFEYKLMQINDKLFGECIEQRDEVMNENAQLKKELYELKYKFGCRFGEH